MARVGVISAYPAEDWEARRIAEAAAARAEVRVLSPGDFGAEIGGSRPPRILVAGEDAATYDLFLTPRAIGDQGDSELQLELYRTLGDSGACLVNDLRALLEAIDKFRSSWLFALAHLPTPNVLVTQQLEEAARFIDREQGAVSKPLFGSLGIGVERIARGDRDRLGALLARQGGLYLQSFVEGARQDVRAFVVGERVEAAVARTPRPGEFRSNRHQAGRARAVHLDPLVEEVALRAARVVGLDYSGVDLVVTDDGPFILEVNGTPSFAGVQEVTGRDLAGAIVEHALDRARAAGRGGAEVKAGPRKGTSHGDQGIEREHERP